MGAQDVEQKGNDNCHDFLSFFFGVCALANAVAYPLPATLRVLSGIALPLRVNCCTPHIANAFLDPLMIISSQLSIH